MTSRVVLLLSVFGSGALAQQRPESLPTAGAVNAAIAGDKENSTKPLAVNDQLVLTAKDVAGIGEKPIRVEPDGTVTLPLVGKVRAAGMTVEEFEKELVTLYSAYVRSPQVSVKRLGSQAETITVVGAFKNPGVYVLSDRRSLLDILSAVGGLQPNAARTIKITRRLKGMRSPLPAAVEDSVAGVSTALINVRRFLDDPRAEPIPIEADDVLMAGPAGMVFLTGEVLRPGTFELIEKDSIGLAELISMGGGFGREAVPEKIKILRPILDGQRRAEISIDVKSIFEGRRADFPVMPNDMVMVPRAKGRARAVKTAALVMVPGLASTLIYLAVR